MTPRGPRPGEPGHLSTCPLCAHARGQPPCLACRDELRTRLVAIGALAMIADPHSEDELEAMA